MNSFVVIIDLVLVHYFKFCFKVVVRSGVLVYVDHYVLLVELGRAGLRGCR